MRLLLVIISNSHSMPLKVLYHKHSSFITDGPQMAKTGICIFSSLDDQGEERMRARVRQCAKDDKIRTEKGE